MNTPAPFIPVNAPLLSPNAKKYVDECIRSGWVSSAGSYIGRFENAFASFIGVKHAVSVTNGTAALHLALVALNVGPGDEVIVPDLTIISCALAVLYTGAKPVFVDVEKSTGTMDPALLEKQITKRTKAIMVVHLYGHPARMDEILRIARRHNLTVIEDAAEAHGALYNNRKAGGIGHVGCFSFYANKIVTTGEGGMVVTNSARINTRLRLLKDLAHSPKRRFLHEYIGYNYRMTNMQAALGLAQLEQVEGYIEKKRWMAGQYKKLLSDITDIELPIEKPGIKSVYWMYALTVKRGAKLTRDDVRKQLAKKGVDTRDFFIPLHAQPVLRKLRLGNGGRYPISQDLSKRGLYIPSGLAITMQQITSVSRAMHEIFV